jgi:hypothetical protein
VIAYLAGVFILFLFVISMRFSHAEICGDNNGEITIDGTRKRSQGANSQAIDFESVKTYPIFTAKNENHGKSNT